MKQLLEVVQTITPIFVAIVGIYLAGRVKQVHVLVNAQRTVLENRIAQLEKTIIESDKDIPPTTRETQAAP